MSELAHMLSFSPLLERATTLPSAVVAGAMGGSASAAAAAGFVSGRRIFLYESYGLPEEASVDTLCLAVSFQKASRRAMHCRIFSEPRFLSSRRTMH